ncbi:IgA-specific serine endopeptidase [Nicoletella semolina]|uniref:IgA-specific serine endopeptidase n=1 Tax=Nicoletella semolina TaxID=271160 RepID=A0A4V2SKF2_9PAST|nr:S6 family peptidase [Nicoletella semolina]MDH2924276.1 hypothetical protein [Nicoletella semolina]TCP18826.1 IgA-specific serine endopeptidase [Nicoletella semolina]
MSNINPLNLKKTTLVSFLSLIFVSYAQASMVRDDIDYQYFRDFALNLGKFTPGAQNIEVRNPAGELVSIMMQDVPMPDLSAVNRNGGFATLVGEQHLLSVAHNSGYRSVSFGEAGSNPDAHYYTYSLVDRNNFPGGRGVHTDYHAPRLDKMVTEVAPTAMSEAGNQAPTYTNKNRFPMFVRAGSGVQSVRSRDNKITTIVDAYNFLTGGTSLNINGNRQNWLDGSGSLFDNIYGGMVTYGTPGDSGSGLFGYDKQLGKWVVVGALNYYAGDHGSSNTWIMVRPYFHKEVSDKVFAGSLPRGDYQWKTTSNKTSTISGSPKTLTVDLKNGNDSNHGKTVEFTGTGTLTLTNNIDQGAGGLLFKDNFTVKASRDFTHRGSGVRIDKGKQVTWQVKNPKGDRLSKIGEGTLYVNGEGENLGDISVGDGTVILAQRRDSRNKQQAFNEVGIVSGRGTVVLSDNKQVNPDKIYFGFRGGRLDLNGNSILFNRIQNVDAGAMIVNHSNRPANLTIRGLNPRNNNEKLTAFNGVLGETDTRKNNGVLNVNIDLHTRDSKMLLSGGAKLKGNFMVHNGEAILSGRPTQYAPGKMTVTKDNRGNKKINYNPQAENVFDGDWINREFTANAFVANNQSTLTIGRNVTRVAGDLWGDGNSTLNLGIAENSLSCIRSDLTGVVGCDHRIGTQGFNASPKTAIVGNLTLQNSAKANINKAHLTGRVQAYQGTTLNLSRDARLTLTANSQVGNLNMSNGSEIDLNNAPYSPINYYTLTVNGDLSGAGQFNYLSNIAELKSDKLVVRGRATGGHWLNVKNTGREPHKSKDRLTLVHLNGSNHNTATFRLKNGTVDVGSLRYYLVKEGNDYRLYNPTMEQLIDKEAEDARRRKQQEEAEKAKKQREAEKQRLAEEAKRRAEAEHLKQEVQRQLLLLVRRWGTPATRAATAENIEAGDLFTQSQITSAYANTAISWLSSQARTTLALGQSLDDEIAQPKALGTRIYASRLRLNGNFENNYHRAYDTKYAATLIGLDNTFPTEFGTATIGGTFTDGKSANRFDDDVTGQDKSTTLHLYTKIQNQQGIFALATLGAGITKSEIKKEDLTHIDTKLFDSSFKAGKAFNTKVLDITPTIGLRYATISPKDHNIDEAQIVVDKASVINTNAQIKLSKSIQISEFNVIPSIEMGYSKTHSTMAVSVNDHHWKQKLSDDYYYRLGLAAKTGAVSASATLGKNLGDDVKDNLNAQVKISYMW